MRPARNKLLVRWAEKHLSAEELERIRMLPTRQNEYGYDPFGFHRDEAKVGMVLGRFFYRNYFRCKVEGLQNIPPGRAMLVANHAGQLPFDAMNIASAVLLDGDPPRIVRTMIEHFVPALPFVGAFFARCGQVVGTPDNCRRLLEDGEILLVFPEGVEGITKPYTQRYQLQRFGLGFMRLCLETRTPVVPVAVIGAEEQLPAVGIPKLGKAFGLPRLPLMVPLPLPSRHHIYFGEPRTFEGDPHDDDEHIELLVKQVRLTIESMIQVGLKERKSVFL